MCGAADGVADNKKGIIVALPCPGPMELYAVLVELGHCPTN